MKLLVGKLSRSVRNVTPTAGVILLVCFAKTLSAWESLAKNPTRRTKSRRVGLVETAAAVLGANSAGEASHQSLLQPYRVNSARSLYKCSSDELSGGPLVPMMQASEPRVRDVMARSD